MDTVYTFGFKSITCSALQDLLYIKAGTANSVSLRRLSLSASGISAAAELLLRLKRLPATVTVGSGGTAPTLQKVSSLNPFAALSTVRANDTAQSTTSGTAQELANWNWNVLQEFMEVPPTEEERWECTLSEALVLDFSVAPGASTVLSGYAVFKES